MNTYKIDDYLIKISTALSAAYDDAILCQQYAWWLVSALTSKTQTELITQETILLNSEQEQKMARWLDELINHAKPLQYILGSVPFCDVDILVEPPVLIPRPETEEWCSHIIEHINTLDNTALTILDLATGSGCIAIALAKAFPLANIIATDITEHALTLAEKNALHNHVHNVTFIRSDLFKSIPQTMKFDMIISNPPYIDEKEWITLDPSVKEWEDKVALVAEDHGLEIIETIIAQAPRYIKPNSEMKEKNIPQVLIEIGYNQGDAVRTLAQNAHYNEILIRKDLEKKDRLLTGRVDNVATISDGS